MNQLPEASFDAQMERIKLVTGKRTQFELATFFGVRQSLVSDAKRRGKIPPDWLATLLRAKNVNPEWLLTGKGNCFLPLPPVAENDESGEAYAVRKADEETLRRLPSRMLADELVRRITASQKEACSKDGSGAFAGKSKKK